MEQDILKVIKRVKYKEVKKNHDKMHIYVKKKRERRKQKTVKN